METVHPLPLIDRLKAVAALWCTATGRSLGALSTQVTNQGSFFERLGSARSAATTVTLEKFARYLADPANWPECGVPQEAETFAHVVGVSVPPVEPSPDNSGDRIETPTVASPEAPGPSPGAVHAPAAPGDFTLTNPEARVA